MSDTVSKLVTMGIAVVVFVGVTALLLLIIDRGTPKRGREAWQIGLFLAPALLLLAVGLVYPVIRTVVQSFENRTGEFVGSQNYVWMFTRPEILTVIRNTVIWVVLAPVSATVIGLAFAIAVDKARAEGFAKSLVFAPMAISFVGASIIWRFVYAYRPVQGDIEQIGLLNQVLVWLGFEPRQFLLEAPWNTLFLIVIMVWIQAGFAMVILSAAIKAVPGEIVEAARLDGAGAVQMFRNVTLPSIRPALIVVFMTITIATLKVFDIVRTSTGGQFETSVVANELYNQAFRLGEPGQGAALAVFLFVLVLPLVVYQVRQLNKQQELR